MAIVTQQTHKVTFQYNHDEVSFEFATAQVADQFAEFVARELKGASYIEATTTRTFKVERGS